MATTMRMKSMDGLAISLSGLCLVHCLALPVLALSLPILGVFAEAEWVHWLFVAFAVPVSMLALLNGSGRSPRIVMASAMVGLSLLIAGAAGWPDHDWETTLTVAGGLILAGANAINWRRSRHSHAES